MFPLPVSLLLFGENPDRSTLILNLYPVLSSPTSILRTPPRDISDQCHDSVCDLRRSRLDLTLTQLTVVTLSV